MHLEATILVKTHLNTAIDILGSQQLVNFNQFNPVINLLCWCWFLFGAGVGGIDPVSDLETDSRGVLSVEAVLVERSLPLSWLVDTFLRAGLSVCWLIQIFSFVILIKQKKEVEACYNHNEYSSHAIIFSPFRFTQWWASSRKWV